MSITETPPQVVQGAVRAADLFGAYTLLNPPPDHLDEGIVQSVTELRDRFPHVDATTLVAICDYAGGLASGLLNRPATFDLSAEAILRKIVSAYAWIGITIAAEMHDELEAAALAEAESGQLTAWEAAFVARHDEPQFIDCEWNRPGDPCPSCNPHLVGGAA